MGRLVSLLMLISDKLDTLIEIQNAEAKHTKAKRRQRKLKRQELYSDEFEKCWVIYPRKVGKPNAAKAYDKAIDTIQSSNFLGDEHEFVFNRIKAFAATWPKTRIDREIKFCPHLSTWLNQQRFFDSPEEWKEGDSHETEVGPSWQEW